MMGHCTPPPSPTRCAHCVLSAHWTISPGGRLACLEPGACADGSCLRTACATRCAMRLPAVVQCAAHLRLCCCCFSRCSRCRRCCCRRCRCSRCCCRRCRRSSASSSSDCPCSCRGGFGCRCALVYNGEGSRADPEARLAFGSAARRSRSFLVFSKTVLSLRCRATSVKRECVALSNDGKAGNNSHSWRPRLPRTTHLLSCRCALPLTFSFSTNGCFCFCG